MYDVSRLVCPKEGDCELYKCLGTRPSVIMVVLVGLGWFVGVCIELEIYLDYVVFALKRAVVNCTNI